MDTDTLVDHQIADGRRLAAHLVRDGLDVTAVGWIKPSEEGRSLYGAGRPSGTAQPEAGLRIGGSPSVILKVCCGSMKKIRRRITNSAS